MGGPTQCKQVGKLADSSRNQQQQQQESKSIVSGVERDQGQIETFGATAWPIRIFTQSSLKSQSQNLSDVDVPGPSLLEQLNGDHSICCSRFIPVSFQMLKQFFQCAKLVL